jgi:hypothetical protein
MLEVCLHAGDIVPRNLAAAPPPEKGTAEWPHGMLDRNLQPAAGLPQQYQKGVQSTYSLLPRPPQTPAAHFKRLYRK